MRILIHRTDAVIWHKCGDLQTRRTLWAFAPSPKSWRPLKSGAELAKAASVPVALEVPIGSRVDPAAGRLFGHFARGGADATTVYHLAIHGLHGCRLAADQVVDGVIAALAAEDLAAGDDQGGTTVRPPDGRPPDPGPDAVVIALSPDGNKPDPPCRWGIAFADPGLPGSLTFLDAASVAPGRRLASTVDRSAAATWPDRDRAAAWMAGAGLDPGRPVPLAEGSIYPEVAELVDDLVGAEVEWVAWQLSETMTAILAARAAADPADRLEALAAAVGKPRPKPKGRSRGPAAPMLFAFD